MSAFAWLCPISPSRSSHMSIRKEIVHVRSPAGSRKNQVVHLVDMDTWLSLARETRKQRRVLPTYQSDAAEDFATATARIPCVIFVLVSRGVQCNLYLQPRWSSCRDLAPAPQGVPLKINEDIDTVRPDALDTLAVPSRVQVNE